MFSSLGEIVFSFLNYNVHWYGIIMGLAIAIGLFVILAIKSKYYKHISTDAILDLYFYLIISGIVGARLYYVLADGRYYYQHPLEIFQIWNGGLSIHGALLGAIIIGFIYCKKHDYKFLEFADLVTYGLVIGQSIGRWGNFFNSEAFGLPTNLPWKLFIPAAKRPLEFLNYEFFHPTFLYESVLNLLIFIILFCVIRKIAPNKNGIIFFCYLILYSFVRFFIESIRIDSVLDVYGVPIAQVVCVLLFITGVAGVCFIFKKRNTKGA